MPRKLFIPVVLIFSTLLASCSQKDEPVRHFSMPSNATGVEVYRGAEGELKQFLYVTSTVKGDLNSIQHMDKELRSATFSRCDSGDDSWFVIKSDSKNIERKRLVRFYRTGDKYTLAMLGIDQTCGSGNQECNQITTIVFNTYPWWLFNRSSLINKTCEGRAVRVE